MQQEKRIAILGGGSFGSAIADLIAAKGLTVHLWMRNKQRVDEVNLKHTNEHYLPGFTLHQSIKAFASLAEAVEQVDLVFVAVPSQSFREVSKQLALLIAPSVMVVSLTKGIEAINFLLMSQVLAEVLPNNPRGVMSGPNLAKEIVDKQITATVIATEKTEVQEYVQSILHSHYFRVYSSQDVYGVELAGALKNCYAIICGMAAAIGCGQNTIGFLITRSLAEMSRFADHLGADPMTFLGLSGVGDLVVTCMSPLSRNYQVGFEVGLGNNLEETTKKLGQIAEGVNTLRLVKAMADKLNIYMPLVQGMNQILFEKTDLNTVVSDLMAGEQALDVEFIASKMGH